MKSFLLVDAQALCYKAYYVANAIRSNGTVQELPYGIIHGVFSMLKSVYSKTGCSNWAFFWDSKTSYRKEHYPDYKGNREKPAELIDAFEQFDMLRREILPQCRFVNNFIKKGLEADDLIASVCKNDPPEEGTVYYILSSDKDLFQLLSKRIFMFKLVKSTTGSLYGYNDFVAEYGIRPKDWKKVKALVGCKTDNVPGLYRIGEKTAIAYVNGESHRGVDRLVCLLDTPEAKRIVERNRMLTTLPYEGTPSLSLDWETRPNPDAFFAMCEQYGFTRFLKDRKAWQVLLDGSKKSAKKLQESLHIGRGGVM